MSYAEQAILWFFVMLATGATVGVLRAIISKGRINGKR